MKRSVGSILIVENNLTEQMLIKTAFEAIGVQDKIYAVNDGDEAIAFLKGEGQYSDRNQFRFPTFLLTDLNMEKVNGFELLLYLKRSRMIIIPTIVFSLSCDPEDIGQAYLCGANAFHTKPANMEGLRLLLKSISDYWSQVQMPEIDEKGNLKHSAGGGKERIRHPVTMKPF